jgi:hypothetical protein
MTPSSRLALALLALGVSACVVENGVSDEDKGDGTGDAAACDTLQLTQQPADQSTTTGQTVALSAAADPCDDCGEATLSWQLENAPLDSEFGAEDLDDSDTSNVSFVPDVPGTYVFSVTATDACGNSTSADFVVVTVTSSNGAPVADCGDNQTADINQRVDFDGVDSFDPEGAELSWSWSLSSTPDCSALQPGTENIFNGATSTPSLVPDCEGVFVVGLVVYDGEQWSEADYCSVTVGGGDEPPVADAGSSATLSACADARYELNGFGSYDPEGRDITYTWSVVSVPSGSSASDDDFNDASLPNPTFAWDVAGSYTFQLQVHDGVQYSPPDIVSLTFVDEEANNAPIANAGVDQTIDEQTECETASYEWTCEDCPAVEFDLDASSSDDSLDGDDLDFMWTESTGELTIGSAYSALTTATTPTYPSEYGVTATHTWDVQLAVSDCADSDTDSITLTYTCTGEYSP